MCDSEAVGNLNGDTIYFTKSIEKDTTVKNQASMKIAGAILFVIGKLGKL